MDEILNYSSEYPNIPIEICLFFSNENGSKIGEKQIHHFCNYYQKKYATKNYPQPRIVARICDALCDHQHLSVMRKGGPDNAESSYVCFLLEGVKTNANWQYWLNKKLNYLVYGFKFIYDDYKKYVLPVEFTSKSGDVSLGTCFLYNCGIATAKHCIEGAKKIAIRGISKELLKTASYEIHTNALMDLAFIRPKAPIADTIMFSNPAEVLDEVMTLGYPKISGYHNFLAAENATVSSRFTTSVGQVAASAEDIWMREQLFLITAKIKGGNSGGPVIGRNGAVVGISVNMSEGSGDYDNLGYGTVIPVSFLDMIIANENKTYLNHSSITFEDFNQV